MHFSSSTSATPYSLMEMASNLHLSIQLYIRYIHLHSRPHLRLICTPHYIATYSRAIWKFLLYCHIQHFLSYGVLVRGRLYCLSPFHLKYASAIAGAVGIEVISPIPMAPQATFSPGLSTTMASISESHESGTGQEIHTCQLVYSSHRSDNALSVQILWTSLRRPQSDLRRTVD